MNAKDVLVRAGLWIGVAICIALPYLVFNLPLVDATSEAIPAAASAIHEQTTARDPTILIAVCLVALFLVSSRLRQRSRR